MSARKLTRERLQALQAFAAQLGISFANWDLLHQALTHTSYANEIKKVQVVHNERLEFLGDAVLELVISSYLYRKFPDLPEGELTKARASLVCEPTLARRAVALQIGDYLLFGRGELVTGGKERASILADAFEAVIGAIYMDQGIESASQYVLSQLHEDLVAMEKGSGIQDYKTCLQEIIQQQAKHKITYELISETGPDHDKCFCIAVLINDCQVGVGEGKSKKEAAQHAAREALRQMKK